MGALTWVGAYTNAKSKNEDIFKKGRAQDNAPAVLCPLSHFPPLFLLGFLEEWDHLLEQVFSEISLLFKMS